jgi:hypothetical protein
VTQLIDRGAELKVLVMKLCHVREWNSRGVLVSTYSRAVRGIEVDSHLQGCWRGFPVVSSARETEYDDNQDDSRQLELGRRFAVGLSGWRSTVWQLIDSLERVEKREMNSKSWFQRSISVLNRFEGVQEHLQNVADSVG